MYPRVTATMAFVLSLAGLAPLAGAAISFQWINDLPGGDVFVYVSDVSADGTAVVGTSHTAAGNRAFRWTAAGGTVALPPPPGVPAGAQVAEARAVSGDGSVVVGPYNVPAN